MADAPEAVGLLHGLRIVDLSQLLAGPFCTMLLGDLGAEVIKVEPLSGDHGRDALGPKLKGDDSAGFLAVNRNKSSIAVDLKDPRGKEIFTTLARTADVVVENFRPGVTQRLGIDYETLREVNPQLVYVTISAFGDAGPYGGLPGLDLIIQAMSGLMSVTGDGSGAPLKAPVPVSDLSAGLIASLAAMAGIYQRQISGKGHHVETTLLDAALSMSVWEFAELWATNSAPEPTGSAHRLVAPYQAFRASDGYLVVGASNQRLWERFCSAINRPDLVNDPRFATNDDRMRHRADLCALVEASLELHTKSWWVGRFLEEGVPAGPILDYAEVKADSHVREREMLLTATHPVEGSVVSPASPIRVDGQPSPLKEPAPVLGADTEVVLQGLGYTVAEVEDLLRAGVVRGNVDRP